MKASEDPLQCERHELLEQQTQLIQFLLCGGAKPAGVGSESLAMASRRALLNKRRRAVEKCHPSLALGLGAEQFRVLFSEFAAVYPGVHSDGPCADARQFLDYVNGKRRPEHWMLRLFQPIILGLRAKYD